MGISGVGICPFTDASQLRSVSIAGASPSYDDSKPGQSVSGGRIRSPVDELRGKPGLGVRLLVDVHPDHTPLARPGAHGTPEQDAPDAWISEIRGYLTGEVLPDDDAAAERIAR